MRSYLTFDYELHGNGSGSIRTDLLEPTEKILEVLDHAGIKGTFFVEVLELIQIERHARRNVDKKLLREINLVFEQIQLMYSKGHAIELHIHPQWHNARVFDGEWQLDFDNWSCATFASDEMTFADLVRLCIEKLKGILSEINPEYRPCIFRAGSYCAQPSSSIYDALLSNGINYDSSVVPGMSGSGLSRYRYVERKDYGPYRVSPSDFGEVGESDIVELPIFSMRIFALTRVLRTLKRRVYSGVKVVGSVNSEHIRKGGVLSMLSYLFSSDYYPLDPVYLSRWELRLYFRRMASLQPKSVVMVSHPKGLLSTEGLKLTIDFMSKRGYRFETLADFVSDC